MRYVEVMLVMMTLFFSSCISSLMKPAVSYKVDIMDYTSFYIIDQPFDSDTCICPTHVIDVVKDQIISQLVGVGLKYAQTKDNSRNIKINIGITKSVEIGSGNKHSFAYPSFHVERYDYLNYYYYTPKYLEDVSVPDKLVIDFVDSRTNKLIISVVTAKVKYGNHFVPDNLIAKYISSAMKNVM